MNSSLAGTSDFASSRAHSASVLRLLVRALLALALMIVAGCASRHVALVPGPLGAGDWPIPRGDIQNHGVSRQPLVSDQVTRLLWRQKLSGVASTEPVVRGQRLYLATQTRRLEVRDPATGQCLSRLRFKGVVAGIIPTDSGLIFTIDQDQNRLVWLVGDPPSQAISVSIPVASTAPRSLPDGSVIIGSFNGQLSRYDSLGTRLWTVDCKGPIDATPSISDSLLYVSAGRLVSARRISDGQQVWSHRASGAVMAAPAIDDRAYFGSTDSLVYAVNLQTGSLAWFFAAGGQIVASPTVGSTRVFVPANDQRIYALAKQTGDTVWTHHTSAPLSREMTLASDLLLVGTLDRKLLLINAIDGTLVREFALEGACVAPPVVANNRVYVCDSKRWLYCFGAAPEQDVPVK